MFLEQKFVWDLKIFSIQNFVLTKKFGGPKIFKDQKFFAAQKFSQTQKIFKHKIFLDP